VGPYATCWDDLQGKTARVYQTHWPHKDHVEKVPGKIIYVYRNTADVFTSFYHHTKAMPVYDFNGDWDVFFGYVSIMWVV
jgi:hypothetical protein